MSIVMRQVCVLHTTYDCLLQVEDASVWDHWVESAFNEIDTDASGSLDSSELRDFLCKDGSCLSPEAVEDAVRGLAGSSEGMNLDTFRSLLAARADHDDLHVFADRRS